MGQLNSNLPYISCFIRNSYIYEDKDGVTPGYIFGVKAMLNRPLLFHFQTNFGAVIWMQHIGAFCWKEEYDCLSTRENSRLSLLETWDCQSNSIAVTTFAFLQNKRVDVLCRDKAWRPGKYITTIDDYDGDLNELNVGYANHPDSKCWHMIQLDDGNFCVHPNNILRWHNPDFIVPYSRDDVPRLKVKSEMMTSENIDRTYGNNPYFFYNA